MAWANVCTPKELGGLGIHSLKALNDALRSKWLWTAKTSNALPWNLLLLEISDDTKAIFQASSMIHIGSGTNTLLWQDHWVDGYSIPQIAPDLEALVKPRALATRTMQEGLPTRAGYVTYEEDCP